MDDDALDKLQIVLPPPRHAQAPRQDDSEQYRKTAERLFFISFAMYIIGVASEGPRFVDCRLNALFAVVCVALAILSFAYLLHVPRMRMVAVVGMVVICAVICTQDFERNRILSTLRLGKDSFARLNPLVSDTECWFCSINSSGGTQYFMEKVYPICPGLKWIKRQELRIYF